MALPEPLRAPSGEPWCCVSGGGFVESCEHQLAMAAYDAEVGENTRAALTYAELTKYLGHEPATFVADCESC